MRPLLLAFLLFAGCGADTERAARGPGLSGGPWALASGLDVPGWERHAPTATFADGRMTGTNGCNRYSTRYTVEGTAMELGSTMTTAMACSDVAEDVQSAFEATRERVSGWRIEGAELVLVDARGRERLRFTRSTPLGEWRANGAAGVTATFSDTGELSGSSGCNRYEATFTAARGEIEIDVTGATKMGCPGSHEQETAYLDALARAKRYTVAGSKLTLRSRSGTPLVSYMRAR